MNTPNKITITRIILVIPLITLFCVLFWYANSIEHIELNQINAKTKSQYFMYAIGVLFVISMISDFIDGYLARKNNLVTSFGKLFDPLADKIIITTTLVFLAMTQNIYLILVIIFIIRDLVVDGSRNLAAANNLNVAASIYGKLKTLFQSIAIPLILFISPLVDMQVWWIKLLMNIPMIFAVITSLFSGFIYFKQIYPIVRKDK